MKRLPTLAGPLIAGVLASLCCIGPLVLGAVGLGSLGVAAALAPLRPWFLALTAILLAIAFYRAYRPQRAADCEPGGACVRPDARHTQRIALWVVSALTLVVAAYPQWSVALARAGGGGVAPLAAGAEVVSLDVQGMTCEACAIEIERELNAVPGVSTATVDYGAALATIAVPAGRTDAAALIAAVERAGYRATLAGAAADSSTRPVLEETGPPDSP